MKRKTETMLGSAFKYPPSVLTYQGQKSDNDHIFNLVCQLYRKIITSRNHQSKQKGAKNGVYANELGDPGW